MVVTEQTMLVSAAEREAFDARGYVVFPKVIAGVVLEKARQAYRRMLEKAETGQYPHVRIYDNLLRTNTAGIEHIFHPDIYEPDLFAAVVESRLLQRAKLSLNTTTPVMLLNRIHCTTRYSHTGIWHRDADPGTEPHLQMGLLLYDEDRFFVIPGSHSRENTEEEQVLLRRSIKSALPEQAAIGGSAGDLLVFKSAILHRGSCIHERAHIHFRFGKDPVGAAIHPHRKEWFLRPEVLAQCDGGWKTMFEKTMTDGQDNAESTLADRSWRLANLIKRTIGTALHHALFFLQEAHPLFERFRWITPNLRLRKLFHLR
jgi:hypothetical protein